jgi:hypothetical protein
MVRGTLDILSWGVGGGGGDYDSESPPVDVYWKEARKRQGDHIPVPDSAPLEI